MSTLGSSIPPRPAAFTPDGIPPGFKWNPLPIDRPIMAQRPRLGIDHTNAGPNRSSMAGQRNWALSGSDTTKPTYQIGLDENDGAEKWLRSDQRAIANGTVTSSHSDWDDLEQWQRAEINQHGRSAEFSYAIETIDLGANNGLGGHSDYQGEMLARAFAYESITHDHPLAEPATWFGAGVSCHTLPPGGYPFWTNARGKTCPGDQKKADFRAWVLPRAIEIRAGWLGEEGDLANADEILLLAKAAADTSARVEEEVKDLDGDVAALAKAFGTFRDREFERDKTLLELVRQLKALAAK